MSAIREFEHNISDQILAGSTRTTLSDLAALAILDSHTPAVVPFADRDPSGRPSRSVVTPWSRVFLGSFCRHVQVRDNDSNDSWT